MAALAAASNKKQTTLSGDRLYYCGRGNRCINPARARGSTFFSSTDPNNFHQGCSICMDTISLLNMPQKYGLPYNLNIHTVDNFGVHWSAINYSDALPKYCREANSLRDDQNTHFQDENTTHGTYPTAAKTLYPVNWCIFCMNEHKAKMENDDEFPHWEMSANQLGQPDAEERNESARQTAAAATAARSQVRQDSAAAAAAAEDSSGDGQKKMEDYFKKKNGGGKRKKRRKTKRKKTKRFRKKKKTRIRKRKRKTRKKRRK